MAHKIASFVFIGGCDNFRIMSLEFTKMHGLGNDFVVCDMPDGFDTAMAKKIADRRFGVGCDQLMVREPARSKDTDMFLRIYNADGSEAQACGNGTRCVAHQWMTAHGKDECVIETVAGLLRCRMAEDDMVTVDMGAPRLEWQDIPLAEEKNTLHLGIIGGDLTDPVAVNMGNPHTVFFVEHVERVDIAGLGPQVERHVLFPERTNVEFAQVLADDKIRLRVWERGAGVTQACGSGACATMVAAVRRGLTGRTAEIVLDGGSLHLEWRAEDNHVLMTGPVAYVFDGVWQG